MKATRAWELANRIANCNCDDKARKMGVTSTVVRGYTGGAVTLWANAYEYWNYGLSWHLLCASLMLDGLSVEDLP